jgi:hypothetical protein
MTKEEYRQSAARCVQLADKSRDQAIRLGLIDLARCWLRLAEQAEKNSQPDLVYAEPPQFVRASIREAAGLDKSGLTRRGGLAGDSNSASWSSGDPLRRAAPR